MRTFTNILSQERKQNEKKRINKLIPAKLIVRVHGNVSPQLYIFMCVCLCLYR